MSQLKTTPKQKKKISKFQKYWQRAENLKVQITERDTALEALAERIRTEVFPLECASFEANKKLLFRLLDLGQRKSWANWQRQELEVWVGENMQLCSIAGLVDEPLTEELARYDAFRMGVELDENDGRPLSEQLSDMLKEQAQTVHDEIRDGAEPMIARMIEEILGSPPAHASAAEQTSYQQEYDRLYQELRASFDEHFGGDVEQGPDFDDFHDEEAFGSGGEQQHGTQREFDEQEPDTASPRLDNATLQRLFRSTAAVLHPDREPDPEQRLKKQSLMAQLLLARKAGDVMAVLGLYQEHVGNGDALGKDDEKALLRSLERQCRQLTETLDFYQPTSPFHETALELYSPSKSKTEQAIADYIEAFETSSAMLSEITSDLRSMNSLKPLLEARYDHHRHSFYSPFG